MHSNNLLEHVYLCLRKYLWVWLAPMILGLVLSGIYNKLLAMKTYTARQSLILRDDLLGDAYKPSRFESQESLKSAQETILEIARKPQVVKAVLEQLGPASSFSFSSNYPSLETIENVQGNITLSAPNGAEFGKTEAVVLSVKTVSAERSRKFVNLLLDEIDAKLSEVRLLRLGSMRNELKQAGENALRSLNDSSRRLQELEKSFGAEITTIRALNDPQSGGGFDLKLNQIRLEQRQAEAQLSSAMMQRELLQQAQRSGGVEFVTSNELLELQPALQGIMTNLSTAMAQVAIDEGRYTSLHPQLKRSQRAVEKQQQQLFDSIGTTVKGLDSQIETLSTLKRRLGESIVQLESRLEALTAQRVPYATLEEEVKKKTEVYNDVQGQLAQIQSYSSSTGDVAMLTRVDDPQVSSRPDQIGASTAGMVGGIIGLTLGLGLVALIAPPFIDPRTSYSPRDPNFSDGVGGGSHGPGPLPQPKSTAATSETHAESRLKSVTAMQPRPATASSRSKLAENEGGMGVGDEPVASAVLDPIAQHMEEMKQRVKDRVSMQGNEGTPPNKVASPMRQVPSSGTATAKTGNNAAAAEPAQTTKAAVQDKPQDRSEVSSEDVIAELKKLQGGNGKILTSQPPRETGKAENPSGVSSEKGGTGADKPQAAEEDGIVVQRRPALSSFSGSVVNSPKSAASSNRKSEASPKPKPEIVSVERMRSPHVPESITKGRITAESLLQSANKKKDSDDSKKKVEAGASSKEKIASLADHPVQTAPPEGGVEQPGDTGSESRIPSITDYARSLDRKLGSSQGDAIANSINDATLGPEVETTASVSRRSNVRPLDIARSLDDPGLLNPVADNVQPDENRVESSTPQRRSESISDYVGSMDNSVAGLVKGAKGANVEQASVRQSEGSVAPAEKAATKPSPAASAKPVPRDELASSSIPAQIRELSDSFSSFARPSDSE